jgi:hypothetical protein
MFWRVGAQAGQAFFCVLAPLRARHVVAGVKHSLAASFTKPSRVVFEEFDQSAAVYTVYFKDVVELPVTHILPGTMQHRHGFGSP